MSNKNDQSDFSKFSEIIMKSDNSIKINYILNSDCLLCNSVNKNMIKIGSIVLCEDCNLSQFNGEDKIKLGSENHDKYLELYKLYRKKY